MELWFTRSDSPGTEFRIKVRRPLLSDDRDGMRIDVLESEDHGRILLVDGRLVAVESDAMAFRECLAHIPLNARPGIRRVLIVGGGDGILLTELLRRPEIELVTLAEPKEGLLAITRECFPELALSFQDGRVKVVHEEAAAYVRETRERYDLILTGAIMGGGAEELDQAFYCDAFRVLAGDGTLVHRAGSARFPQSRRELIRAIGKVKRLFPVYRVFGISLPTVACGQVLFGFASKRYDPVTGLDEEDWRSLGIDTRHYNPAIHRAAFALPRDLEALVETA